MTRILLDVMCGGLPAYLRMCGHDTAYALDRDVEADDRLLELAGEENRILVTRDRDLAKRADGAVLVTARDPVDQLEELADAGIDLTLDETPSRCGECNGPLETVDSTSATPAYVPDDLQDAEGEGDADGEAETAIWRCTDCGQYFWKGSHWESVRETLADVG